MDTDKHRWERGVVDENRLYQRFSSKANFLSLWSPRTLREISLIAGRRGGFTLVEITIALMVIAVGVMAVFSLISTGLSMCTRVAADTQSSLMASDCLYTVRALSLYEGVRDKENMGYSSGWWADMRDGNEILYVAAPDVWCGDDHWEIYNTQSTQREDSILLGFTNFSFRTNVSTRIVDHILGYGSYIDGSNDFYSMNVDIWDITSQSNRPVSFYTEFKNPGDM